MEIVRKNIVVEHNDTINVYFFGDVHEGNINKADGEFKEAIQEIKNDPKGYWVGMGDMIDAITIGDNKRWNAIMVSKKYQIHDLHDIARRQFDYLLEDLEPIRDKCLCQILGNHEESYIKYNYFDVYDHYVRRLSPDAKKVGMVGFLKLGLIKTSHNDNKPYNTITIALNHGTGGGGTTEGYFSNLLIRTFRAFDADVHIMGHVHKLFCFDHKVNGVDLYDNLKKKRKYFGISGSFLPVYKQGSGNYWEHKGSIEGDIGMLKLSIKAKHNESTFNLSMMKFD